MRDGRKNVKVWSAVAVFATGLVCVSHAQLGSASSSGTPLQFSRPKSAGFTTNTFSHFKKESEASLEEGLLNKQITQPLRSTDGVPPPVIIRPRVSASSQRVRELLERKRDWVFNTPDAVSAYSLERSNDPNSSDLRRNDLLSPSDDLYTGLSREDGSASNRKDPSGNRRTFADKDDPFSQLRKEEEESENLPPGIRTRENELKQLLGNDSGRDRLSESSFGIKRNQFDFSSFDIPAPVVEKDEMERKARMNEFRQMTGLPSIATTKAELFNQLNTPANTTVQTATPGWSAPATTAPVSSFSTPSSIGSQFGTVMPGLPTAPTMSSLAPAIVSPTPAPAKPNLTPPKPSFVAPRRAF